MEKRKDLYIEAHKGLRKGLMNMLMRAGRLDVENDEQLAAFFIEVNNLLALLAGHASHEEEFFGPHIINADRDLADTIAAEHAEYEKRSQALSDEYQQLLDMDRERRAVADDNAYRLCADFVGWYLQHLSHEERIVMPKLQAQLSDEELIEIEHQILMAIAPETMAKYLKLIIPSINPQELRNLFAGMKQTAPPEAFEGSCHLAQSLLPADDWQSLKDFLLSV